MRSSERGRNSISATREKQCTATPLIFQGVGTKLPRSNAGNSKERHKGMATKKFKSDEPPVMGYVVVANFDQAYKFYSKVFGAKDERYRDPRGKTWFSQMT